MDINYLIILFVHLLRWGQHTDNMFTQCDIWHWFGTFLQHPLEKIGHLWVLVYSSKDKAYYYWSVVNTFGPRQNGRHFADDIFKCIFVNENVWIPIKISLKVVPKGPINNIPVLVQILAWRLAGDKPLSEPIMVSLPTHICVTRPQWVKGQWPESLRNVCVEIRILWQELSNFWLDYRTATKQS